jgi:RNA polymerase sigma-70 factor (ECF subfamily)
MDDGVATFEAQRPTLLALAYRMLGDFSRAEDMVQEAWLRWDARSVEVESPRAFLLTVVTRLCLNELDSARARKEESRGDRLPEPVDLRATALGRFEAVERVSMAFLVALQRLTPAERAVLILHEVCDMSHTEIGAVLERSDEASRQLLRSARVAVAVAEERRGLEPSQEQHRALLRTFVQAVSTGEYASVVELLADHAVLVVDAGPSGKRIGRIRSLGRPLEGAERIAVFLVSVSRENPTPNALHERSLNGEPAVVMSKDGHATAAVFVSVEEGKVRAVFVQGDVSRLGRVGPVA